MSSIGTDDLQPIPDRNITRAIGTRCKVEFT